MGGDATRHAVGEKESGTGRRRKGGKRKKWRRTRSYSAVVARLGRRAALAREKRNVAGAAAPPPERKEKGTRGNVAATRSREKRTRRGKTRKLVRIEKKMAVYNSDHALEKNSEKALATLGKEGEEKTSSVHLQYRSMYVRGKEGGRRVVGHSELQVDIRQVENRVSSAPTDVAEAGKEHWRVGQELLLFTREKRRKRKGHK